MSRDDSLVDVIRAIAAGSSVDWNAVDSAAPDGCHVSVLKELRIISKIADVHGMSGRPAPADNVPEDPLRNWGPLTVLEQVAAGAYGVVYRAWDGRLDREVALKLLRGLRIHADEPTVEEGRLLARVRHNNVVTVYGADRIDGCVGIWMEFVDGRTLDAIVRDDGVLDIGEAMRIGVEVARGLAAVHAAGLIHRDIKAQNVMRQPDGRVVLMDFGAGFHGESDAAPGLVGTPLYVAPEVLAGGVATRESDIYMVGVLLFFLLTGRYPVAGRTLRELTKAHDEGLARSLRTLRHDVPGRLARVVERAISPRADRRYGTADELANALVAVRQTPRRVLITGAAIAAIAAIALAVRTVDRAVNPDRGGSLALAAGMSARPVDWRFPWLFLGSPSPDGRWLSYTDARTGNLALLDLNSGASALLTTDASFAFAGSRYVTSSRFSLDGGRIAYSWYQGDRSAEIRVWETTGGTTRTLLHDDAAVDAAVLAWSHDGSHLVVRFEQQDGPGRLELVALADGDRRRIATPTLGSVPAGAAFSPDDRFIVVDAVATAQGPRQLHVIDLHGRTDDLLLTGDDDDAEPFWVGDRVLFSRTREGKRGLWQVPVADGRASGPPTLVSDQLAPGFWSVGLTGNGSLYYAAAEGISSVYTASIGAGADVATPARLSAPDVPASSPEWSPDGREVVWVARTAAAGRRAATLQFHDVATGRERTVTPPFVPGVNLRWSPDGTRLLIRGTDEKGGGVRLIDTETGRLLGSYLLGRPGDVAWDPDGSHFFYIDARARTIGRIDVSTGAEHPFYVLPPGYTFERGLALSPNHDRIAFAAAQTDAVSLMTIPIKGGSARDVLTVRAPHRIVIQQWTRDGRQILFVRSRAIPGAPLSQEWQLWAVDGDGGEPQYLDFSMANLADVRPSPDGTRMVFSSSNAENRLRVLEHVFSGPITQGDGR
jgi:Tol biopolymer transport system component